eukprot:gene36125-38088_t
MGATFYPSRRASAVEVTEASKKLYMQKLKGVIHSALERHSLPTLAKQVGLPCSIYARDTFLEKRESIFLAVLRRFQVSVLKQEGKTKFELGDWTKLPKLDEVAVMLALRDNVDAAMKGFADRRRPADRPPGSAPPSELPGDARRDPSHSIASVRTANLPEYRSIPCADAESPGRSDVLYRSMSPDRRQTISERPGDGAAAAADKQQEEERKREEEKAGQFAGGGPPSALLAELDDAAGPPSATLRQLADLDAKPEPAP